MVFTLNILELASQKLRQNFDELNLYLRHQGRKGQPKFDRRFLLLIVQVMVLAKSVVSFFGLDFPAIFKSFKSSSRAPPNPRP